MLLRSTKQHIVGLALLPILLGGAVLVALTSGTVEISFKHLIDHFSGAELSLLHTTVIEQLRIPRILLAIGVGGALALAGLFVQTLFHNPLVEPYTLGISGGASLAVALATVFGFSSGSYPAVAFLGALSVTALLWTISAKYRGESNKLLLFGVMLSFISSSLLVLIFALVSSEDLQQIIFWTMGSLEPDGRFTALPLILFSLVMMLGATLYGRQLNLLAIGEEESRTTGINTVVLRMILLFGATLLTAIAVAMAGVIGFIGLLVPHAVRALFGGDHRVLVPATFFGGATFLVLTDTLSRTIIEPSIIPVGAITGILGGILFIALLILNRERRL